MKIFSTTKKLVLVVLFVSSIVLNVAIHASAFVATVTAGMYTAVTGIPSTIVTSQNLKKSVKNITTRITRRTLVGAGRNVGSTFGEAIPYVGVAVIVGVTAMELNDACDTVRDLQELEKKIDTAGTLDKDADLVCGLTKPTKEEVWEKVKNSPEEGWNSAKESLPDLPSLDSSTITGPLKTVIEIIGNFFGSWLTLE